MLALGNRFYSGVCHTDHGFCTNSFGFPAPALKGKQGGSEVYRQALTSQ